SRRSQYSPCDMRLYLCMQRSIVWYHAPMPNPFPQQLIERIHNSPHKLVLEFAGAGSQALFWLHSVPGSSRTILEATDRYTSASLADLLGAVPEHAVTRETAAVMATIAYRRAMRLTNGTEGRL